MRSISIQHNMRKTSFLQSIPHTSSIVCHKLNTTYHKLSTTGSKVRWSCSKMDPPICDIFGNPYMCWDKFWLISWSDRFNKSQEKNAIHWYKSHEWRLWGKEKKQAQEWAKLGTNSWGLVSFIEELYFKHIK